MISAIVHMYTRPVPCLGTSAARTQGYSHLATEAMKSALGEIGKKSPTQKKARAA